MEFVNPSLRWCALWLLAVACSGPVAGPSTREGTETGSAHKRKEERKVFTGQSFEGSTLLAPFPQRSKSTFGFDTERAWSGQDDWEPSIAADPSSDRVYLVTTRFSSPTPRIAFRRSDDGGATFSLDTLIPPTGTDQNDPQIAVASDGTVYVMWLDFWQTRLIRSFDHGLTWTAPVDVNDASVPLSDHGWLTISPDGKDVYVSFNWSHSYVSVSHDFGQTFAPPVRTDSDNRSWFHSGGAVTANGDVHLGAVDYRGSLLGPSHINVLSSTDGGLSWTTTRVDTAPQPPDCSWAPGCYHGFLGPFVGLAADPSGTLLLAYNAGVVPDGPQQIYVRSSPDGVLWTERSSISAEVLTTDNCFPIVASTPTPGDFRIVWQGDLSGDVTAWNTWYRSTRDAGASWSPIRRISDLPNGAPYKNPQGYEFPYGDYLGMSVDSRGIAHVIWGEGRSWNGPGGTWFTRGR